MYKDKILIIHGFLHSTKRYQKLSCDLKKYLDMEVFLYEIEGFGGVPPSQNKNKLYHLTRKLQNHLCTQNYKIIIAHSMGCNILLKSLNNISLANNTKIILLAPAYNGINKFKLLSNFVSISHFAFYLQSILQLPFVNLIIKKIAQITVNNKNCIDKQIIIDTKIADPYTSAKIFKEISHDIWKTNYIKADFSIIQGEKDKVIDIKNVIKLSKCLNCKIIFKKNLGHTIIIENYDYLLRYIINSNY